MNCSVLLLCGGVSPEHTVSVCSVRSVLQHIDHEKYQCTLIGISQQGEWFFIPHENGQLPPGFCVEEIVFASKERACKVDWYKAENGKFLCFFAGVLCVFDCVFPLIHGAMGEDGCLQGVLSLGKVPFVGSSIMGSALGMDKEFSRKIWRAAGLPVPKYRVFYDASWEKMEYNTLMMDLGYGFFVKPACGGSSLGVSQVHNEEEWKEAMIKAFSYGERVLCETWVQGQELSCGVLEKESGELVCSRIGEIQIPSGRFYDYDAKYHTDGGGSFGLWAGSAETQAFVQGVVLQSFTELSLSGYARVDGFFSWTGRFLLNEVNTIPGFTETSLFPKLWLESGMPMKNLIEGLVARTLLKASMVPGVKQGVRACK